MSVANSEDVLMQVASDGPASGAVTDLVMGYESMLEVLPNLADRVQEMQSGTEEMAKRLENKMRGLVDGYSHLEGLSNEIPEGIREMAANHRKSLIEAGSLTDLTAVEDMARLEADMDLIKAEFNCLTSDRLMSSMKAKDLIRSAGRLKLGHAGKKKTTATNSSSGSSGGCGASNRGSSSAGKGANGRDVTSTLHEPIHMLDYNEHHRSGLDAFLAPHAGDVKV
jgi:hypothetical protein